MAELRVARPRLIIFSDTTRAAPLLMLARFRDLARHAAPGSVLFLVRDYALSACERLTLGLELAALAAQQAQLFGVADRADLARALGCSALHLPELGLPEHAVRGYLGPGVFLSRACHDPTLVAGAAADAVLLSPIFEARKGRPALGLNAVRAAGRSTSGFARRPALYALGAVDERNAAACLEAGADGVAVIGAALAVDPLPLLSALGISRL